MCPVFNRKTRSLDHLYSLKSIIPLNRSRKKHYCKLFSSLPQIMEYRTIYSRIFLNYWITLEIIFHIYVFNFRDKQLCTYLCIMGSFKKRLHFRFFPLKFYADINASPAYFRSFGIECTRAYRGNRVYRSF